MKLWKINHAAGTRVRTSIIVKVHPDLNTLSWTAELCPYSLTVLFLDYQDHSEATGTQLTNNVASPHLLCYSFQERGQKMTQGLRHGDKDTKEFRL